MKLQLLALFALAGITLSGAENLLLAHTVPGGAPEGRKLPEGVEVTESDDGKLNLKFTRPGSIQYTVYITPELRRLYLSAELKPENLVPGNEDWKNGRLALRFFDRHWKQTGGWPTVFGVSGTHPAQHCSRVYDVPPNAEILLVEPSHFGASGTMEFRNLVLTPAPENLLLAPNPGGIAPEGIDKAPVHATVNPDGTVDLTIDGRGSHRMHVPVRPEWGALKLSMKMKVTDVLHGDADWKDARIAVRFHDAKYNGVGPWPETFHASGTSDWRNCERVYQIPDGATTFSFEPANFGPAGKVEFRSIRLTVEGKRETGSENKTAGTPRS